MKMNTPNKLTILRMILVPIFMAVYLCWNKYAALAIFIVAALTDSLDGYLARKNGEVTTFGKFMDPLADKLLVCAALIAFVGKGVMPSWICMIVVARELAISGLRIIAAANGVIMAAGWSGKIKTFCTCICICVMITPIAQTALGKITVNDICSWIILVTTVVSGVEYFIKNGAVLREEKI